MTELEQLGIEIERSVFSLITPLQAEKKANAEVFQKLDQLSRQLAVLLKGSDMLPRKPLQQIEMAAGILENEAPYAKNPEVLAEMATALRYTFALILRGECHDDRKPGVMRIF